MKNIEKVINGLKAVRSSINGQGIMDYGLDACIKSLEIELYRPNMSAEDRLDRIEELLRHITNATECPTCGGPGGTIYSDGNITKFVPCRTCKGSGWVRPHRIVGGACGYEHM